MKVLEKMVAGLLSLMLNFIVELFSAKSFLYRSEVGSPWIYRCISLPKSVTWNDVYPCRYWIPGDPSFH